MWLKLDIHKKENNYEHLEGTNYISIQKEEKNKKTKITMLFCRT